MRFVLPFFAFFALIAGSAWAGPAERNSSVRLLECDPNAQTAKFQAQMRSFKSAVGLSLRFTLQTRSPANAEWKRIVAPGFNTWLKADPGKPGYIYDKVVENLALGADYRAFVRFRWRSAEGRVVATAVARSRPCEVPDNRANLVPDQLTTEPGSTDTTRIYVLRVRNTGRGEAAEFFIRLETSDGPLAEDSTDQPLASDGSVELRFEAPACAPGSQLTATVDTEAEIDESNETDNVISVACPAAARPSLRP